MITPAKQSKDKMMDVVIGPTPTAMGAATNRVQRKFV